MDFVYLLKNRGHVKRAVLKRFICRITLLLLCSSYLGAQEAAPGKKENTETVTLPANIYDSFKFDPGTAPYVRNGLYVLGPLFMLAYGLGTWQWNSTSFDLKPEEPRGVHAVNGGSDKYGHLFGNYAMKRLASFFFKACGSSVNRANIEGALLTEIITTGGEIGDGFSPNYGFDPYDWLANQAGIVIGMILDYSPFLGRIFTVRWEYFPSKDMRKRFSLLDHHDIFTDYSGAEVMFTTKLGGIPYLSLTPLRYINIDAGYYTRGYRPAAGFTRRTRNYFLGLSANFSAASGDLLPAGYVSSSLQSLFNYYRPPRINWEARRCVISDRPQSEWAKEDI